MIRRPPRSTLPYTTLFRSYGEHIDRYEHVAQALRARGAEGIGPRSEEHTSELQSQSHIVCRLLLEKKMHFPCPESRRDPRRYLALCPPEPVFFFFFLMIGGPPRSTLFPYTPLFR